MARRSTRKGSARKTARRAYTGLKRRARTARSYVRRRGRVSVGRGTRSTGIVKARAMGALREVTWITAGSAAALATVRFMPGQTMGIENTTLLGLGALGYGIWRNDPKGIYIGYGALFPYIHQKLADLILPEATVS